MPLNVGPCDAFHEPVEQPVAKKTIMSALVMVAANKIFLVVSIIVEAFQSALPLMCCAGSSHSFDPKRKTW
jgi:hypothetical protein